jgi:hypothetical protein
MRLVGLLHLQAREEVETSRPHRALLSQRRAHCPHIKFTKVSSDTSSGDTHSPCHTGLISGELTASGPTLFPAQHRVCFHSLHSLHSHRSPVSAAATLAQCMHASTSPSQGQGQVPIRTPPSLVRDFLFFHSVSFLRFGTSLINNDRARCGYGWWSTISAACTASCHEEITPCHAVLFNFDNMQESLSLR